MELKDRIYEVLFVVRKLSETKSSAQGDVAKVGTERIMEIFEEELAEYRSREYMPKGNEKTPQT